MTFQNTTATKKIFSLKKRIRAVSGGTWASKTISVLVWLIDYCQSNKDKVVTVVAESFPHLQLGAIRDFQNILKSNGYWDDGAWNETKHVYIFPTNSFIEFISFDKFGKAHGPRRDVLFINEANNIPYGIADQLITRTRQVVWMDWNPTNEFWFYTDMLNRRDDVDFITLTYLDNEALEEASRREIESHRDNHRWWTVYGLGQLGEVASKIYTGWGFVDNIPHEARLERIGLDFGYTNDPTAIVAVYYYNGGYIFDEIAYQRGLSNKQIADILVNQPKVLTVADSAEPKSIDEIKSFGINILPATKGAGSVNQRIQLVQSQRCSLTKRSLNLIKEYRNYLWKTDKNGLVLNVPEHEWSHGMDAMGYALTSLVPIIRRKEFIEALPILPDREPENEAR